MFITVEKLKIIGIILMIILALGIFSKLFIETPSEKEGFQIDSATVKIADVQNNLITNSTTTPIPLYQPNPNYAPINIEKNMITMVPDGYYLVDGSVMDGTKRGGNKGGGNIAILPTGNMMNPFPEKMRASSIPSGYFKYTSGRSDYLAQVTPGYYIVENSDNNKNKLYNMALLPINNIAGPLPDLKNSNIPSGYYVNKNPKGLVKIPSGYYIIDNTYMAKLPNEDTITPAPNISINGVTVPNGYYITNLEGSVNPPGLSKIPSGYKYAKLADGITDDQTKIISINPEAPEFVTPTPAEPTTPVSTSPALTAPVIPEPSTPALVPITPSPSAPVPVTPEPSGSVNEPSEPVPGGTVSNLFSSVESDDSETSATQNVNNSIINGNASAEDTYSKYDPANFTNVTYHDTPEDIIKQTGATGLEFGSMTVVDATGKKISYPYVPGQGTPTYYTPGSFVFGPSNYVPNYEDSVYLSRTTGLSTVSTAVPANSVMGGFCSSTDKTEIEQKCNSIPADQCASTSCCVLLGGTKCVSGNDKGPTMKSNYTDPTILTKDYYYYQGKCYGFCQ